MRLFKAFTLIFIMLTGFISSFAQTRAALPGTVKGALKDSTRNYILHAATVSIYSKDSTLLNYQLSNNYAEFSITGLPVDVPLKLEISYTGYDLLEQPFTIPSKTKMFDFQMLYMQVRKISLKEVKIRVPPISMNGDTLEINPSAFKLDSNAVIEDVLRRTPGVQLWGDGVITVNGREVKNVYVDGKPFFGSDAKIALQNLPNQVVQKVQVYREPANNPLDSALTMNIKLKKNRKVGMFGKISGGYGTTNRYEADAGLNTYNSKMQLGVVGAANNVNKVAYDATNLLSNATFKGVGAAVTYQPDFRLAGITSPVSGGMIFKYDFFDNPRWDKKSSLSANYFILHKNTENTTNTETQNTLNNATQFYTRFNNNSKWVNTDQNFDNRYELATTKENITFSQRYNSSIINSSNQSLINSFNNQKEPVSSNNSANTNTSNNNKYTFNADYQRRDNTLHVFPIFKNINATYAFTVNNKVDEVNNLTDFQSLITPAVNRKIDRRYNTNVNYIGQNFRVELPNINQLVKGNFIRNLNISIINTLAVSTDKNTSFVYDRDSLTNRYVGNAYLSDILQNDLTQETPELRIVRSFTKSLSNRFDKGVNIVIVAEQNFVNQNTRSVKSFRNIQRYYNRLLPKLSLNFHDNQYGEYYRTLNISYGSSTQIPQVWQLVPLTDSVDAYNLIRGNNRLKQATTHTIALDFNHTDQKTKNAFNVSGGISASVVTDAIVDSVYIDAQNRRNIYFANADNQKKVHGNIEINKALNLKSGELQLKLSLSVDVVNTPDYINGKLNTANTANTDAALQVFYSSGGLLDIQAGTDFNQSNSKQQPSNIQYKGKNYAGYLNVSYNIAKRFNISSNIIYNESQSSNNVNINFTIWNANVTYRLLKGNNVEIKLSALDLLHQNTSVINYAGINSLTTGTQTVLRQYFLAALSYYPRFFKKN